MSRLILLLLCLLAVSVTAAQEAAPTSTPLGPVFVPSPTFTSVPTPVITPTPPGDDPRIAVCSAPFQPGWKPYLIQQRDWLANLLVGVDGLTVAQVAALNCLDDSAALPIGAVIWLPPGAFSALAPGEPQGPSPGEDRAGITSLTASATQVLNEGQDITFSWQATGTAAYFYMCPAGPQLDCWRPLGAQPVPLTYTTPPISGFRYAGPVRYRLEVVDGEAVATQDIGVEVVCAYEAMSQTAGFNACPVEPIRYVFVAWQAFERGVMMWISETRQIWVMTFDSRLQILEDTYQEGDPTPAAVAPEGMYTPQRGFGRVWEQLGGPRGLGWALGKEMGYDAGWQPAGRYSFTTFVGSPFKEVYAITIIPGSDTGYWVKLR
ncbi:MAG: hypothetical protein HZC41_24005 [Chloroflexi bacterium]|nr:hypothetical protein [Chloroflexota bacterium]